MGTEPVSKVEENSRVRWAFGVFFIVLAVFVRSARYGYSGYDDLVVLRDGATTLWRGWGALAGLWTGLLPGELFYIPWSYTALTLERGLAEYLGFGFPQLVHAVNSVLHAANTALVFLLVSRKPWAAAIAALLYGLHPLQVEVVGWTLGQRDLWSAFFAFSSVLLWPRFALLSLGTLALSLVSKPTSLPIILVPVLLAWGRSQPLKSAIRYLAMSLFVAVPVLALTLLLRTQQSALVSQGVLERVTIVLGALGFYSGKLLYPATLVPHYPRWALDAVRASDWFGRLAAFTLVSFWPLFMLRKLPAVLSGFLLFVILASPSLGVQNFSYQVHSVVADRFLYLALFGIAVALAGLLEWIEQNTRSVRSARAISGATLLLLAFMSFRQLSIWEGPIPLWNANLQAFPESRMARANLAKHFSESGRYKAAIQILAPYVDRFPQDSVLRINLGVAYAEIKEWESATKHLAQVLKQDPANAIARRNLGNVYFFQEKWREALAEYELAVQSHPDARAILHDIGDCHFQLKEFDAARFYYHEFLKFYGADDELKKNLQVIQGALKPERPSRVF